MSITAGKHVLCSLPGGLVFAHVQMSDAQNGQLYKCDMYNSVLRESIGGSYTTLDVIKSKL